MPHLRVLIVDDDPTVRRVAALRLEVLGHRITEANNGHEAVSLCVDQGQRFDVILMDLAMPLMDGCEATRLLKANLDTQSMPIIILSASDPTEALEAGADLYVKKPYKGSDLVAAIQSALAIAAGRG